eukprot:TRINITY_DN4963_c0_g1_i1.p2 TRINITY_DN4963_c0_g1~~TRINITY_DN4963_c0_g1_i1.p2  ORF type:complete len:624 (+),score=227.67 TRINITY_DN4963_c0_g1_i1:2453-4324(+)
MARSDSEDESSGEMFMPLAVRRAVEEQRVEKLRHQKMEEKKQHEERVDSLLGRKRKGDDEGAADKAETEELWKVGPLAKRSLLEMNIEAMREERRNQGNDPKDKKQIELEEREKEEAEAVHRLLHDGKQLKSVYDLAHDIKYTERMKTTWTPPKYVQDMTSDEVGYIRSKNNIIVEGDNVPNPCLAFRDLRLPEEIIAALQKRNIIKPTPIQMQGLPVILSGCDMIGVAFTGSGKTLTFVLPMVLLNYQEEKMMPLKRGEGPLSLALTPSRELAWQHHETYTFIAESLKDHRLRCLPAIGGTRPGDSAHLLSQGIHSCVATPGRLNDMLKKKSINLNLCTFIALDEADRMVDMGFEDELRTMYQHFRHQRQTVMFSATMPKKIQSFARTSLVDPVTVNVNRAGAANLDVTQEVEYVEKDAKLINILDCLQKTAPPVLIFAESKHDVDFIHEYLLLKCVDAVSIHGGKDQSERNEAVKRFRNRAATVLVATDIASKGLDFPDVQHVINYDLPKEIENYVHRIGRTGRNGKTGLATTFINKSCPETALLDLKHLLLEAKQKVPPILMGLHDPLEELYAAQGKKSSGCAFCGGLGHTVSVCPKLQSQVKSQQGGFISTYEHARDEM